MCDISIAAEARVPVLTIYYFFYRPRVSTTALWSTTTLAQLSAPCRLLTAAVCTKWYAFATTPLNAPGPATDKSVGDPCQLGLPVEHLQQGGHLEPLPHLRRRSFERSQRRSFDASVFCFRLGFRSSRYVGHEDWSFSRLWLRCFP